MPQIKMKHIVSFSSEDPAHPADNLLKSETYRKWQCADPAEKQASVIIELEKAYKIHSIDIGNNGSAFVEVLAGRSSSSDFQVLLVASSFMSPAESKSGINNNRVRMFGPDKLSKAAADQKWDRIKFVCTQPYSKTSGYGLSFVSLHSPPESMEKTQPQEKTQATLGAFLLKDEPVDTIVSGSLFAKRKEKVRSAMSTAAELREASKNPPSSVSKTSSPARLTKQEDEDMGNDSGKLTGLKRKVEKTANVDTEVSKGPARDEVVNPPSKKVKVSGSKEQEISLKTVLRGVVFALSGFKNPERGHLRDKALSLGARYQGDWDSSCTHLICAFVNTPKYIQVKAAGKGKIVNQNWINDCHKRRRRISEKRYKLRGDASDDSDSDSSTEDDKSSTPSSRPHAQPSTSLSTATVSTAHDSVKDKPDLDTKGYTLSSILDRRESKDITKQEQRENDKHKIVKKCDKTDDGDFGETDNAKNNSEDNLSSGHDTDDEIRRVMNEDEDPYSGSTECDTDDEEDEGGEKRPDSTSGVEVPPSNLPELPSFFANMVFFLYGEFEADERRTLTRYITAYDGELEEYMNDNVKYVITSESWDDSFDEALGDNSSLAFVRPKWIHICHEKRSLVPFQPYIVVPR